MGPTANDILKKLKATLILMEGDKFDEIPIMFSVLQLKVIVDALEMKIKNEKKPWCEGECGWAKEGE